MKLETNEDIWETAYRAYVLVRVGEDFSKAGVAKQIFGLNEVLDSSSAFITRTSVVTGDYDIVVPVYTRYQEILEEVVDRILNQDGVNKEKSTKLLLDPEILSEEAHTPWPPHEALGYIPLDEANPVNPGPTGFNAWG